jgi:drug/metabolite transporter (DMT)-like permease
MQPEVIPIIGAGVVASITAVTAAVFDRFNKPSATICVLLAGSVFWIYFLTWYTKIPELLGGIGVFGLFASAPLFVLAALLFKSDWRGEPSKISARLSAVGVIAGGATTFLTLRLLAKIP